MISFTRLLLFSLVIFFCFPTICSGLFQEEDVFYFSLFGLRFYEIIADEEQYAKFSDIESEYSNMLTPLQERRSKLDRMIHELEKDGCDEIYSALTPSQMESINSQMKAETQENVTNDIPFLKNFTKFASLVAKAEGIEVFEGYPRTKPNEELTQKTDPLMIHGFNFYPDPLVDTGTSIEELRQTLTNHYFFKSMRGGGKFCGEFHPDMALRFDKEEIRYHVMICFTCYEIWLQRDGAEEVFKFDFNSDARRIFLDIAGSIFVNHKPKVRSQ